MLFRSGLNLINEAFIAAILVALINILVRQEAAFISKLSLRKKKVVAGMSVRFYMEEITEADFRVFLMQILENFPMLTLRSFQSGKTSFFPSSREFVCEILFDKKDESHFKEFIVEASKYLHLLKLHQETIFVNS